VRLAPDFSPQCAPSAFATPASQHLPWDALTTARQPPRHIYAILSDPRAPPGLPMSDLGAIVGPHILHDRTQHYVGRGATGAEGASQSTGEAPRGVPNGCKAHGSCLPPRARQVILHRLSHQNWIIPSCCPQYRAIGYRAAPTWEPRADIGVRPPLSLSSTRTTGSSDDVLRRGPERVVAYSKHRNTVALPSQELPQVRRSAEFHSALIRPADGRDPLQAMQSPFRPACGVARLA
jgi:hypothetical protein